MPNIDLFFKDETSMRNIIIFWSRFVAARSARREKMDDVGGTLFLCSHYAEYYGPCNIIKLKMFRRPVVQSVSVSVSY